jgi:hypothetical protein
MAYDLASLYTDTLSVNSLSKTIIDQLMADRRFSSVSKITLSGSNYSSGSASSDPIGYTETGRPIYDTNVGVTMNDELKATMEKAHSRNNDSMLTNMGSTMLENTSSGNIATFVSKGTIKAFVTEDGRFTGKIRLENIEDLNKLTLDTSRFYTKGEVSTLLSSKVSKPDLFNDEQFIKSELLDKDIVRVNDFEMHYTDGDIHIVADERIKWNAKYDKPVDGIPEKDIEKVTVDKINNAATKTELASHTNNGSIHTSSTERTKWNAKYDKPSTGIPETDFSELVQNKMNSAAKEADLKNHKEDNIRHLDSVERTKWNAKYDKPAGGIPKGDLTLEVQSQMNAAAKDAEFKTHVADSVAHITSEERSAWNAKYQKPAVGVPITDLDSDTRALINNAATKSALDNHAKDSSVHITPLEREEWNEHGEDTAIHLSEGERAKWNAKYDKPSTGIPETDLGAGLQTKINNAITEASFTEHTTDSVKHVSSSERSTWNAKYAKPSTGIPEADISEKLATKINAAATDANLKLHEADVKKHVSDAERASWTAKYAKPVAGIPEADLSQGLQDKIGGFATKSALSDHISNPTAHVTTDEKIAWNAKYVKPETGIPATDLDTATQAKLKNSASDAELTLHVDNSGIHVTAEQKQAWTAKYARPETGIPEADLASALQAKIGNTVSATDFNQHATDTIKHVTSTERSAWTAKYNKPELGIPETDLSASVAGKLNSAATKDALKAHVDNADAHVTVEDKADWNAKYDKPAEGIPAVDLEDAVSAQIQTSAEHVANADAHVTVDQKSAWTAKYDKPAEGIPAADLEVAFTEGVTSAVAHVANADAHVTVDQKASWDAKYDKPEAGVPVTDLEVAVQEKLALVPAKPFSKEVAEAATTVAIEASEHGIVHDNAFEFVVTAFVLNGEFFEEVKPSLVRVNATTQAVEVQFAEAFTGTVVVR